MEHTTMKIYFLTFITGCLLLSASVCAAVTNKSDLVLSDNITNSQNIHTSTLDASGTVTATHVGDGSALTVLNGTQITSGTIPDARNIQSIATTATPQFAREGLGVAADSTVPLYHAGANNATTSPAFLVSSNTQPATSGNPKGSYGLQLWGNAFNTTGNTNAPVSFSASILPTSAATTGGSLIFSNYSNGVLTEIDRITLPGGARTLPSSLSVATTISTVSGNITAGGAGNILAGNSIGLTSKGVFYSVGSVDGDLGVLKNDQASLGTLASYGFKNVTKTVNYTVVSLDSSKTFNNSGAPGAINFTLPPATAGIRAEFYVATAQWVTNTAVGSDVIRKGTTVSAAAGHCEDQTVGSWWEAACHITGTWDINLKAGSLINIQ